MTRQALVVLTQRVVQQALELDVVDVTKVARMLEQARERAPLPAQAAKVGRAVTRRAPWDTLHAVSYKRSLLLSDSLGDDEEGLSRH